MKLTTRQHEILSCALMGTAVAFQYMPYSAQAFCTESIIHSVHSDDPTAIDKYAGYYGQAVQFAAFAAASLFTPSMIHFMSAKWTLFISSVIFSIFYLGFYHVTSWLFYCSQFLVGVGYAVYNSGEGAYVCDHSSRETLETNTGLVTAIGHQSMMFGGVMMFVIFYFVGGGTPTVEDGVIYRHFSTYQIQVIYGSCFGFAVIAVLTYLILPTKQFNSISSSTKECPTFIGQLKSLGIAVVEPNALLLAVTWLYQGMFTTFYVSVFPTTFSFVSVLSGEPYLVAYYSIMVGLGVLAGGFFISIMSKRILRFGQVPTMLLHCGLNLIIFALITAAFPKWATVNPTNEPGALFEPKQWLCVLIGFFIGLSDATVTTARSVMCQLAVPHRRNQVYALGRMYQSIAACILFFFAPRMSLIVWVIVLTTMMSLGTITYATVAARIQRVTVFVVNPGVQYPSKI